MPKPAPDPEIKQLDVEFCRLYYGKDVAALREFLDPDFTYVDGGTGEEVSRADFERWCLDAAPMRNLIHDQVHTKLEGDTAILAARNSLERQVDGTWVRFDWRYVNVYRRKGGKWRCIYATVYKVA